MANLILLILTSEKVSWLENPKCFTTEAPCIQFHGVGGHAGMISGHTLSLTPFI